MQEYTSTPEPSEDGPEVNPLEGVTFKLDGTVFECQGRVSLLDQSELAAAAVQGIDTDSRQGRWIISEYLRAVLGPDVYMVFRSHVRRHGTSDDTIMAIIAGIQAEAEQKVVAMSGRPTVSQSRSSPGPTGQAGRAAQLLSLQGRGDISLVDAATGQPGDVQRQQELAAQEAMKAAAVTGKKVRPVAQQAERRLKIG